MGDEGGGGYSDFALFSSLFITHVPCYNPGVAIAKIAIPALHFARLLVSLERVFRLTDLERPKNLKPKD